MINKLLFPREQVPFFPLLNWISSLSDKLSKIIDSSRNIDGINDFVVVVNQGSLIYAHLGLHDSARKICETAIKYYFKLYKETKNTLFLSYVLQPWINLARLDIITKNYDGAMERLLSFIENSHSTKCEINKDTANLQNILLYSLQDEIIQDHNLAGFVKTAPYIDIINVYLAQQDYEGLLQAFPSSSLKFHANVPELLEGMCIAAYSLENISLVEKELKNASQNQNDLISNFFSFRYAEINMLHKRNKTSCSTDKLLTMFDYFSGNNMFNSIYIKIAIATMICAVGDCLLAEDLYNKCYEDSIADNNEWGQFLVLREMAKKNESKYKDALNNLLNSTYYCKINNLDKSNCAELNEKLTHFGNQLFHMMINNTESTVK